MKELLAKFKVNLFIIIYEDGICVMHPDIYCTGSYDLCYSIIVFQWKSIHV